MKPILLIVFLTGVFAVAGCNTVRGVGQDIQKGGEAIQKATR